MLFEQFIGKPAFIKINQIWELLQYYRFENLSSLCSLHWYGICFFMASPLKSLRTMSLGCFAKISFNFMLNGGDNTS